jgi:hypothetical protein
VAFMLATRHSTGGPVWVRFSHRASWPPRRNLLRLRTPAGRCAGLETCEGCMSIDVRRWHREGLLCAGQRFSHPLTWMWMPTEGVDVVTEVDAVVLIFRSRSWGGKFGQIIRQRVPITWTLCALGGRRPWFRCDAYYRGRYCGRRVALLYSGGGPFSCRSAAVSRMRARMKPPPFARLTESERSECA